jgi:hypothetical protein
MFGALQTPVGKSNEDINRSVTYLVGWDRFSSAILLFDMSKISKDIRYASDFGGYLLGILFGWRHRLALPEQPEEQQHPGI